MLDSLSFARVTPFSNAILSTHQASRSLVFSVRSTLFSHQGFLGCVQDVYVGVSILTATRETLRKTYQVPLHFPTQVDILSKRTFLSTDSNDATVAVVTQEQAAAESPSRPPQQSTATAFPHLSRQAPPSAYPPPPQPAQQSYTTISPTRPQPPLQHQDLIPHLRRNNNIIPIRIKHLPTPITIQPPRRLRRTTRPQHIHGIRRQIRARRIDRHSLLTPPSSSAPSTFSLSRRTPSLMPSENHQRRARSHRCTERPPRPACTPAAYTRAARLAACSGPGERIGRGCCFVLLRCWRGRCRGGRTRGGACCGEGGAGWGSAGWGLGSERGRRRG